MCLKSKVIYLWLFVTWGAIPVYASAPSKLMRFADIHLDRIVFTYAGDLWVAPSKGGTAHRLTSHPGIERSAKFSPDGKWIAFTGQYKGEDQVFIIPSEGGVPKQLTYYPTRGPQPPRRGYDNQVYGWLPSGEAVLFQSGRDTWNGGTPKLYTVSRIGGMPKALPIPQAGSGAFSPDGKKILYSPLFRDFRSWKHYQGGWAQDLYVFDLAKRKAQQITHDVRSDRDPMWVGNEQCFTSDRGVRLNLYCRNSSTGKLTQLTFHKDWDVRWPSEGPKGKIVYELGGVLRVFDTIRKQDNPIDIVVPTDAVPKQKRWVSVSGNIESFNLSPHGKRSLFVARGDIFDVPCKNGLIRNLTYSSDAHERDAEWSPDGKKVVFISDHTGEEELWWAEPSTLKSGQLTKNSQIRLYDPRWSPNGRYIAYSDASGKILVVRWKDRKIFTVADERYERSTDYSWSPYGGYLAFSLQDDNQNRSIYIWSAADRKTRRITTADFSEFEPAWDPGGKYLYFLSLRDFRPQMDWLDFNFVVNRGIGIFAFALRRDVPHPFPACNDAENEVEKTISACEENSKDKRSKKWSFERLVKSSAIRVDFDGLEKRVARLPIPADNYSSLHVTDSHVLFLRNSPRYRGRDDKKPKLEAFLKKDRKKTVVAHEIEAFTVSWDGKRILARSGDQYKLVDVDDIAEEKKCYQKEHATVSIKDLRAAINPALEWKTIFDEVWRRFRDYFYVQNMHGYDWQAIGKQYRSLLPYVGHRSDLNYIIGEMIAELNVSHAYIEGGNTDLLDYPKVAMPGARFELDPKTGMYRISEIFAGHNEEEIYRAPLTEIGVDARIGDFVLAINGQKLTKNDNPYELLRLETNRPIELILNQKPVSKGARQVVIQPLKSEYKLLYLAWVSKNRLYVKKATKGRVGYIHIPDMSSDGIREFVKWFYPQTRKQGLIVDVRYNGGGSVSQLLIERLQRKLLMTSFGRYYAIHTYPQYVLHGSMVCLINESSASDGDIFPWAFRQAGIGPLIGKRTWGGVVGITNHGPLLDGGSVYVPEFSTNDTNGNYIIEGIGVKPDIEVENDPVSVIKGRDRQLDRAIEEVMKKIKKNQWRLPERKPSPVKTKN